MFNEEIKAVVFDMCIELEKTVKKVRNQQDKYTDFYPYTTDVPGLVELLKPILEAYPELIRRNILFSDPPRFHDSGIIRASIHLGGSYDMDGLFDIFDDFINFTARCFLQIKTKPEKHVFFSEQWQHFETDFFAEEVVVTFRGFVYCFWFDAGGVLEDTIPERDLRLEWQGRLIDSPVILNILQRSQYSYQDSLDPYPAQYSDTPHYILKNTIQVKKTDRLEDAFQQARANFEKVTFLMRIICGGGAHYSAITADMVGNRMNQSGLTAYEPLNQQFCPLEISQFAYPSDVQFQNLWPLIKQRDIGEFRFQNQKYRDFAQIKIAKQNYRYGKDYDLTLKLEKILDLVQIIEATMGDFGTHNAEYIEAMFSRGTLKRLQNLINLRNLYAHGKPRELDLILKGKYQDNLDLLESDIESFMFFSRLVLEKAVSNPNLRSDLLTYHLGLGRKAFVNGSIKNGKKIQGITFPHFQ